MKRVGIILLSMVCMSWTALAQQRALQEQVGTRNRVALLIGNSNYVQSTPGVRFQHLDHLSNPCNDVERISGDLEAAGWDPEREIIKFCDATLSQMRTFVDQFRDRYLSAEPSLGFIYYAGHGIQLINETYLFGIDTYIDPSQAVNAIVTHEGVNPFHGGIRLFGDLLSEIGDAGSGSIFVVIDACRDTPIDQIVRNNNSLAAPFLNAQRGYPRPRLGIKMLYSTSYGDKASDGIGANSPFAAAFDQDMKKQSTIDHLVASVIRDVRNNTRNSAIPQTPDTTGSLNPPPPEDCLSNCEASP